jgi:hypothetical protein
MVWDRSSEDRRKEQLSNMTPSSFVTPLDRKMPTVLEAMSYFIKMDDHWWSLAKIMVGPRFENGEYVFGSGITVYEERPQVFRDEEQNAVDLVVKSLEVKDKAGKAEKMVEKARKDLEKMEKSMDSLNAAVERKEKDIEKLVRTKEVASVQGKIFKGKVKALLKSSKGNRSLHDSAQVSPLMKQNNQSFSVSAIVHGWGPQPGLVGLCWIRSSPFPDSLFLCRPGCCEFAQEGACRVSSPTGMVRFAKGFREMAPRTGDCSRDSPNPCYQATCGNRWVETLRDFP